MRRIATVLALLVAAAPLRARGQEAAPAMPEDPRAPRFHEVERGLFTGFEVGYLGLFKTPTADRTRYPFAGSGGGRADGFGVTTTLGYDLNEHLALSAFALGGSSQASPSYGAFSLFSVGGDLRLALLKGFEVNGVDRLFVYLHARGGYLVTYPTGLLGSRDVLLGGGPGLEYYTRLRHFSVGLAVDALYLARAKAAGVSVAPTVRYTF